MRFASVAAVAVARVHVAAVGCCSTHRGPVMNPAVARRALSQQVGRRRRVGRGQPHGSRDGAQGGASDSDRPGDPLNGERERATAGCTSRGNLPRPAQLLDQDGRRAGPGARAVRPRPPGNMVSLKRREQPAHELRGAIRRQPPSPFRGYRGCRGPVGARARLGVRGRPRTRWLGGSPDFQPQRPTALPAEREQVG